MYSEHTYYCMLEAEWDEIWDLPLTVCDLQQVSIHVSWILAPILVTENENEPHRTG